METAFAEFQDSGAAAGVAAGVDESSRADFLRDYMWSKISRLSEGSQVMYCSSEYAGTHGTVRSKSFDFEKPSAVIEVRFIPISIRFHPSY